MSQKNSMKGWVLPDILEAVSNPSISDWQSYFRELDGTSYHDGKAALKKLAETSRMSADGLIFAVTFRKNAGKALGSHAAEPAPEGIALFYDDQGGLATIWLPYDDHEYTYLEAAEEIALFATGQPLLREKSGFLSGDSGIANLAESSETARHSSYPDIAAIKEKSDNFTDTIQERMELFNEIPGVTAEEYDGSDANDPIMTVRVPFNRGHLFDGYDPECFEFYLEADDTFRDADNEDQGERSAIFEQWIKAVLRRQNEPWQYLYSETVRLAAMYAELPAVQPAADLAEIKQKSDKLDAALDELAAIFNEISGVGTERGDDDEPDTLLVIKVPFNNIHIRQGYDPERIKFLLKADNTVEEDDYEDDGENSAVFNQWRREVSLMDKPNAQQFYDKVIELSKLYADLPQIEAE